MKRISRRNFLKAAGVGAAALGLAACGSSSSSTGSSTTSSAAASATPAEDVTIKVAAIETAYGSEMWQKVTEAFTAQTGIKVELTTDKNLEDVIGPSMQGGDYPDVIHLATGREAALTEQFIKGNLIADITDVLSMTVPGESKKVSEKIAGGFTDTSLTNPYGDGKTYLAPMFYSPCGLFYNAGFLKEKGWDVPKTWDEMWIVGEMGEAPRADGFEWGMTALPAVKAGGDQYSYTWFEQAWIPAGAEHLDAAKQFVAYLYSDEACKLFAESGAIQPVLGIADDLDGDNKMFYSIYDNGAKAAMGNFASFTAIPGVEVRTVFFDPVNSLVSGSTTDQQWIDGIN